MSHLTSLIQLRLTTVKNILSRYQKRSRLELATLILFLTGAGIGLFFFFYHSFKFLRAQEPFGPILVNETFFLFNFTLFLMLFISSAVSAYSSLFRSWETPFLLTRGVSWTDIYFIKLLEALWYSSWSLLFVAIPFMSAYGMNTDTPRTFYFPLLCFSFYIPFVFLAGTLGALVSTLAVWLLPNKNRRRIAFGILIATVVVLFLREQPEEIKEQGSISGILTGYLPNVKFAKHPLLPSYWTSRGILMLAGAGDFSSPDFKEGIFYFLVLLSNALFFAIPSISASSMLYSGSYLKAQDSDETIGPAHKKSRWIRWFDRLAWPSRQAMAFLEKDLKTFKRDPAEWSQLLIFFGLLLVYFMNLKNLEFHALAAFWKNLVFVLNTVGTYIVLSSFSMRFVFPMLSMEGSKSWMIGLAPISFSSIILEKFLLGTFISLVLTMPLVFLSGWMLDISFKRVLLTTALGLFVCVALTGLSVGMGAKFPNFKSNNPTQIISGFGGSVLLVLHLLYLAFIGAFLMLSKQHLFITFLAMAAVSLLAGTIPLHLGVKSLKRMEF